METSIFMDLTKKPKTADLEIPLGNAFAIWKEISDFVFEKYPAAIEDWHISVKKYGWGFRLKDKKRAIIYLSPREGFFRVAMIFGQKATDQILISDISDGIKNELMNSKVYPEGRVIRLEVRDHSFTDDIKKLIAYKLAF
jgi:hypothetical protein